MKKHKHENNPFSDKNFNNNDNSTEEVKDSEQKESENTINEEFLVDEANETNAAFDKLQNDYEKLNNQYVRLAADFDNFRKRQEQERESLLKYGTEEALKKVIEVLDNFDRAQKSINDVEDCEKLKETFNILHKQTIEALTKMGLEMIDTDGQKFDPNFHEAVMQTPTSDYPEETIIQELQKGYKYSDKVLRPALVNVAVQ